MSDINIPRIKTESLTYFEANLAMDKTDNTQKLLMMQTLLSHDEAGMDKTTAVAYRQIREAEAQKQASSMRNPANLAIGSGSALLFGAAGVASVPTKNGPSAWGMKLGVDPTVKEMAAASTKASGMYNSFAQAASTADKITNTQLEANRVEYKSKQDLAQAEESDRLADKQRKNSQEDQNKQAIDSLQYQEFQTKKAMFTSQ